MQLEAYLERDDRIVLPLGSTYGTVEPEPPGFSR